MMRMERFKSEMTKAMNQIFGQNLENIRYGTINGLIEEKEDIFNIIGIANEKPHNGDFKKFMHFIEEYCKKNHKKLAFLEIHNPQLFNYLLNREYGLWTDNGLIRSFI